MKDSKIEWCDHTFNPWIGCTKVSPGCANCYAETLMDKRYGRAKWGDGNPRSRTGKDNWAKPLQWNRAAESSGDRPRVFCASLADWLDWKAPVEWRIDLLNLIWTTPALDWLLLTKRPESWHARMMEACHASPLAVRWLNGFAPHNVWLGTSAEDQHRWNDRLPYLMDIPAKIRFVSVEPLLGQISMVGHRPDWMIVGGESGPGSRPMEAEWVLSLRDECAHWNIPFLFKQWGGVDKKSAGRELAGRTHDAIPTNL